MTAAVRRQVVALFLLVSGATGLVYEVVWSKVLSDVLGNSGQAHAIVLATFMGGLAAGAWLFGGLADRVRRPLALYAGIELFVGLYALAFPAVQGAIRGAFLAVAPAFSEEARAAPKLLFAALSLLPPTVAMGGTMPAMLKHATRAEPSIRATLARLYALNSFGAAFGAWLAGTVWIPNAGLGAASRAAGLINLLLAGLSFAVSRFDVATAPATDEEQAAPGAERPRVVRAAIAGLLISGFTAMIYETGWIRLVTLTVGASTYAFTWIVATFIFGLAAGSLWESRRPEGDSLRSFGRLQLALVLAVCATLPLYLRAPYFFLQARSVLAQAVEAFPIWQGVLFLVSLLVMVLPTFLMGASFPLGARVLARQRATLGRRLGLVWAANTVGTVAGALLGGLWLMPAVGLERLFTIGLTLSLVAGAWALWAAGGPRRRLWPALAAAVAIASSWALFGGWAPLLARLSPFRVDLATVQLSSAAGYVKQSREWLTPEFVKDDTFATVFVGHVAANPSSRFLMVNGKPDASTSFGDQSTQTLVGHLGLLLAPRDAKTLMMVGAGAGVSLGASLTHDLARADLVEISPGVLEAARLFADVNHGALDDPRVRIHLDDARTFLTLSDQRYDVIISEPSNPWVSGISSLFTAEFFAVVDRHLAADGVLVQWLQAYEINDELVRLVLRTVRSRFPHTTLWQGGGGDLILVASRQPLQVDFEQLARRLARPAVREDLARVDVQGVDGVLALQVMAGDELAAWAGEGPLNTDDFNQLEYRAPVAFFAGQSAHPPDGRRRPSSWPGLQVSRWLAAHPLDAARAAAVFRAVSSGQLDDDPLRRPAAQRWLTLAPDDPDAQRSLATIALRQWEPALARAALPERPPVDRAALALEAELLDRYQRRAPWLAVPLPDLAYFRSLCGEPAVLEQLTRLCNLEKCEPNHSK